LVLALITAACGDYLLVVSGPTNTTQFLVLVSDSGSVSSLGSFPSVREASTLVAQCHTSAHTYYVLLNSGYLFSYNLASDEDDVVSLQVPEPFIPYLLCISQQSGDLYTLQVHGSTSVFVVVSATDGSIRNASSPYTLPTGAVVQQCVVDDVTSRIIWTFSESDTTTFHIAATDLLPLSDGRTSVLYTSPLLQPWLLTDPSSGQFYATTLNGEVLQTFQLSISVAGVVWTPLGRAKGVQFVQGTLNEDEHVIAVMDHTNITKVNMDDGTVKGVNMQWNKLTVAELFPSSVTWCPRG